MLSSLRRRQEIMRAVLAIALVLAVGLVMVTTATKAHNYPRFFKGHRAKLREIRGFKPEYLSTAIGFGKRVGPAEAQDLSARERILLSLLGNFPREMPAEVLLRTMQANPALANRLTQLVAQNDQGDEEPPMMEHPKLERTLALI
ncbi:allatotropin isoform X2 [Ooceraea biroi]|uniref:allatotropin isoform X2 n=1 Tax=Ooceraea biroi TaxID=2015173 RepID=UPI0005BB5CAC|nr:allatotropin isoform X2 [Ooceraea biroi]